LLVIVDGTVKLAVAATGDLLADVFRGSMRRAVVLLDTLGALPLG
jgi:hypothetical protein